MIFVFLYHNLLHTTQGVVVRRPPIATVFSLDNSIFLCLSSVYLSLSLSYISYTIPSQPLPRVRTTHNIRDGIIIIHTYRYAYTFIYICVCVCVSTFFFSSTRYYNNIIITHTTHVRPSRNARELVYVCARVCVCVRTGCAAVTASRVHRQISFL